MKRPITFIVVDDDPAAISHIQQLVRPFKSWALIKTFTDPAAGLDYLKKHHVDFVLLDMEMPNIDGRAFMLQMPPEVKVILYTAHDEYATDGFDYGVVDFLKKPVSMERLNKAMGRMAEKLNEKTNDGKSVKGDYYYFVTGQTKGMRKKIFLDDIVYIESMNSKTYFYLVGEIAPYGVGDAPLKWDDPNKQLGTICGSTLKDLEEIFKGTSLMQIHRSIIFNVDYLDIYNKQTVKVKGFNLTLPVGKPENYPEFYEYLRNNNLPNM